MKLFNVQRYFIPILIVFTVVADLQGFARIDSVIRGWDGCDLGSIARNYYRNGFHFLYPQIDWGGNGPGYVEMQFPLVPFVTAVLYKLFGMKEQLAIIIPFLTGIGTVIAVYHFASYKFDSVVGFFSGMFVALSPWWAWQTTIFLGDPAMIFCGVLGLYYLVRWNKSESLFHYLLSAFFVSLSILLKLPALYLGFPLLFLWLIKYRSAAFRQVKFWLYGVLVLLPPLLWYYHAYLLYAEYGNTFGIIAGGYRKFSTVEILLNREFYSFYLWRTAYVVLTPFVTVLFIYGMVRKDKGTTINLFRVWCISVIVFQLSAAEGTGSGGQYLIPLLPPAAIIAGYSLSLIIKKIQDLLQRWEKLFSYQSSLVFGIIVLLLIVNYIKSLSTLQYLDRFEDLRKQVGKEVEAMTEPGSLIIIASTHVNELRVINPNQLDSPSQMFYYCDRKGWFTSMKWLQPEFIEQCRKLGASYFLVPLEVQSFSLKHPVSNYLITHYSKINNSDTFILFDIRKNIR